MTSYLVTFHNPHLALAVSDRCTWYGNSTSTEALDARPPGSRASQERWDVHQAQLDRRGRCLHDTGSLCSCPYARGVDRIAVVAAVGTRAGCCLGDVRDRDEATTPCVRSLQANATLHQDPSLVARRIASDSSLRHEVEDRTHQHQDRWHCRPCISLVQWSRVEAPIIHVM